MTWTRLSDTFNDQPVLLAVGRSARLLHVEALVWSNRLLTDGAVPRGALPRLTDSPDVEADVGELLAAGLWEETDTGYQLPWADQEKRANVEARQKLRNERQQRYRNRKTKCDEGDHSECDSRHCKKKRKHEAGDHSDCAPKHCASVTHNATSNGQRHEGGHDDRRVTPSRPGPSRPDPKGGTGTGPGQGRATARSASATRADARPAPPGEDDEPFFEITEREDGTWLVDLGPVPEGDED